jgi:O-succinylhomoserine sulfhydrylase
MSDPIRRQNPEGWRLATRLVRGGTARSPFGETSEALFLNSGFRYDDAEEAEGRFKNERPGFVYSRFGNPTVAMFEDRMIQIEGAEAARATASGMAAVNAAMLCQLRAGDHVVAAKALFGSCVYILQDLLPRFGVTSTLVEGSDLAAWQAAVRPNTKVFFLESPSNPGLDIVDIAGVAKIANAIGARVVVDNVFATPLLQRPLELGAHVVVYSATKHIDGQGRCLGGIVLGDNKFITEELTPFIRHTGPSLSPFNAWVMLKGLETLELRVTRHCENAARVAHFLAGHPKVASTIWPGLKSHPQHDLAMAQMSGQGGPLICFSPMGDKATAFRFLNALKLIDISNNLGDAKSLITHPATTTHQRLTPAQRAEVGVTETLLRLSVGLEDGQDLLDDLDQALAAA